MKVLRLSLIAVLLMLGAAKMSQAQPFPSSTINLQVNAPVVLVGQNITGTVTAQDEQGNEVDALITVTTDQNQSAQGVGHVDFSFPTSAEGEVTVTATSGDILPVSAQTQQATVTVITLPDTPSPPTDQGIINYIGCMGLCVSLHNTVGYCGVICSPTLLIPDP
jgi:hypothetical protein